MAPRPAGIAWYFKTAGAGEEDEYQWLAWEPGQQASQAELVLMAPVAGSTLVKLTSVNTPSSVLARLDDGQLVFYATRLTPPGAPEKGDHMNRRISASVLGVAAAHADPSVLIDAAVAALNEELASRLPLRWTEGSPAVDREPASWPLPGRDTTPGDEEADRRQSIGPPPASRQSIGLPPASRRAVAAALAALDQTDLQAFPGGRIVLLETDVIDLDQLDQLRPWRVVSPLVKQQVTFPRGSKSGHHGQLILLIIVGLAALAVLGAFLAGAL
jgi:hypothetical protein